MSTSEDEASRLDAATAQKLVKEFEGISNTDEIFAQYMLQEHGWDLRRALDAFFSDKVNSQQAAEEDDEKEQNSAPAPNVDDALAQGLLTVSPPDSLTMVTWNIDGLDVKNLQKRTKAVCKILENERADIVFLQEVIPETFSYIESKLSGYECIAGGMEDYFVATLLRRGRVYRDASRTLAFPGTCMNRNLLHVAAHSGQVKLELLNTHLESTAEHSEERKQQLTQCFKHMGKLSVDRNILFGGDLNLRDKELAAVGGLPQGAVDCWVEAGRRKEAEFTWDLTRNTNLEWSGRFKPRCRFDRLYLRPSSSFPAGLTHFGLLGLQKISGTQSFPSDHWGIRVDLRLTQTDHANKRLKME